MGEKPIEYSSSGAIHLWVCSVMSLTVVLNSRSLFLALLSPTLTMDMPAIDPAVSQALFLAGHQHRSTKVRSHDYIKSWIWTSGAVWGHLRLWPGPTSVCTCP